MDKKCFLAVLVGCVFMGATLASGAAINYANLPGDGNWRVSFTSISESSGTDPNVVLFGAPDRVDNDLYFTPTPEFSAYAGAGAGKYSDTTNGTLVFTIEAPAGKSLDKIVIWEQGDYTLAGSGTSATMAKVNGTVQLTDYTNGGLIPLQKLQVSPAGVGVNGEGKYTLPNYSFDTWSAYFEYDLTGRAKPVTKIKIQLQNNLQATAESAYGTEAYIQKKSAYHSLGISVETPEPASLLGLLVLSSLAFGRRKV